MSGYYDLNPQVFYNAIRNGDLDAAWTCLSNSAEQALCGDVGRCCPRSAPWNPQQNQTMRSKLQMKELLVLRQLRRLHRRALKLAHQPGDHDLCNALMRGCVQVRHLDPALDEVVCKWECDEQSSFLADRRNINLVDQTIQVLTEVLHRHESDDREARLTSWHNRMKRLN